MCRLRPKSRSEPTIQSVYFGAATLRKNGFEAPTKDYSLNTEFCKTFGLASNKIGGLPDHFFFVASQQASHQLNSTRHAFVCVKIYKGLRVNVQTNERRTAVVIVIVIAVMVCLLSDVPTDPVDADSEKPCLYQTKIPPFSYQWGHR